MNCDKELIIRIIENDKSAEKELYDKYCNLVYFNAIRYFNKKQDFIPDAVNEAWIQILKSVRGNKAKNDNLKNYIISVCRFTFSKFDRDVIDDTYRYEELVPDKGSYDPSDTVIRSILSKEVLGKIKDIKDSQLVYESLVLEMSNKELAKKYKVTKDRISTRLRVAKYRLKVRFDWLFPTQL